MADFEAYEVNAALRHSGIGGSYFSGYEELSTLMLRGIIFDIKKLPSWKNS